MIIAIGLWIKFNSSSSATEAVFTVVSLRTPTSAAALVLLRAQESPAGFSPTGTTPRRGRLLPSAAHSATCGCTSWSICRTSLLPEITTASCQTAERCKEQRRRRQSHAAAAAEGCRGHEGSSRLRTVMGARDGSKSSSSLLTVSISEMILKSVFSLKFKGKPFKTSTVQWKAEPGESEGLLVGPCPNHAIPLCLSFLTCKIRTIAVPMTQHYVAWKRQYR